MGVKSCHRNGCESIMVDTYINGIGYVCDDCQKEFKTWFEEKFDTHYKPKSFIHKQLKEFMDIEKTCNDSDSQDVMSVDQFFE